MSELEAAVAAGVLGAEEGYHSLLQSTVEVARAIFRAKAASIFLLDEERDELVFEAVSGEGAETLVGQRFPSSTGVAGWVLVTRQPLVVDDLTSDTRFSRDAAQSTGYVPKWPSRCSPTSGRSACSRSSTVRATGRSRSSRWTC